MAELAASPTPGLRAHPNAGLPNAFGEYDETPEQMAESIANSPSSGFRTSSAAAAAPRPTMSRHRRSGRTDPPPRPIPAIEPRCRLSGLEPLNIGPTRCSSTSASAPTSPARRFKRIKAGYYDAALDVARQQVENGAQIIDINMDEGMLDSEEAMITFLNLIAAEPDISRVPVMIDSSKWESILEAGLKRIQGKGRQLDQHEGRRSGIHRQARLLRRHGAAVIVMAFDEQGQADTEDRKIEICQRAYRILTEQIGFPPQDIIFDPNIFAVATGIAEHNNYAVDFIEATRGSRQSPLPGR